MDAQRAADRDTPVQLQQEPPGVRFFWGCGASHDNRGPIFLDGCLAVEAHLLNMNRHRIGNGEEAGRGRRRWTWNRSQCDTNPSPPAFPLLIPISDLLHHASISYPLRLAFSPSPFPSQESIRGVRQVELFLLPPSSPSTGAGAGAAGSMRAPQLLWRGEVERSLGNVVFDVHTRAVLPTLRPPDAPPCAHDVAVAEASGHGTCG